MPKSGADTKEKILATAEGLVLGHGFAGASIDKVIERAGITKGTFFYHFKSKNEMAKDLIERFHQKDMDQLNQFMTRAEKLSPDALQQILIFVGLLAEMFDELAEPYPGCLFASYVYQSQQFDDEIMCVCSDTMKTWRAMLGGKIREAISQHPPRQEVDADVLADLWTSILEGALVLSKTMNDPKLVAPQLEQYRRYLQLLFAE